MEYSIQELTTNTNTTNTNPMIPILIGQKKSLYKEALNFIDLEKTQLQLTNADNSIIDETTLSVDLKSWNLKSNQFTITYVAGTKEIALNLALTERLPNSALFIVVDTDDTILFSSTVDEFIYQQSSLVKIILTESYNISGSLKCYIVCVETKSITGNFDFISNILTINTDFIFKTPSIKFIYDTSSLSYVGISNKYSVTYIDKITQDQIDAEKNIHIKAGMILDKAVIIISYPDDKHIGELLEDLEKLKIGYYIVPINISNESIKSLVGFVKSGQDNNIFMCILISSTQPNNKIVKDAEFTVPEPG